MTKINFRQKCAVAMCVLLSTGLSGKLFAQADTTGTSAISGTVSDPSGKSVGSATVAARNEFSGAVKTATTTEDGKFAIVGLPSGNYAVDASAPGLAFDTRTGIQLSSGGTVTVPVTMHVAAVSQTMTVESAVTLAVEAAPSQSSLDAMTAESVISSTYIRNFTSPVGDYSDVLQMAPGTFAVASNGPGLGDTKTFFRGFKDGFYNMTFDGLPFNDTNDPTHHSWTWFPLPFIGSTVFDRSPGDATAIGPSNSGGSINLQSREIPVDQDIQATVSYGSFNTRLLSLDYDSGAFGKRKAAALLINLHNMQSDGYQTYNSLDRWSGDFKYQYKFSESTVLTAYTGVGHLASNTPNVKGPTRAQVAQFGDNYLLNNIPTDPLYYKFNSYAIPSDFDYVGLNSDLGHGWHLDDKVYSNRYYNHQQYNNGTSVTTTSATDKLNSYRKYGNSLNLTEESKFGILRVGVWYEWANTDRFQTPTDPHTFIDLLSPNFHEKFITQSAQPFAQYEYRVTHRLSVVGGIRMSNYNVSLNQYADNGKTIGCINGGKVTGGICSTDGSFVNHAVNYNTWQPSVSARYRLRNNYSVYGQFATGNVIPPSSVFDTKNAAVLVTPKPTTTKAFQFGSVFKTNRFTLDADAYFIKAGNAYTSSPDPASGEPVYYKTPNTNTRGFEVEANATLGHGLFVYGNATVGSAKYEGTKLWVANSPKDTETIGLTYLRGNWDVGFFNKRIGQIWNDNGGLNQAVNIDPYNMTNLFFNYTIKQGSYLRGSKIRFGVNNLLDNHNIVGVTPASTASNAPAAGDFLTLLAARSFSISMTFGYAPKK